MVSSLSASAIFGSHENQSASSSGSSVPGSSGSGVTTGSSPHESIKIEISSIDSIVFECFIVLFRIFIIVWFLS